MLAVLVLPCRTTEFYFAARRISIITEKLLERRKSFVKIFGNLSRHLIITRFDAYIHILIIPSRERLLSFGKEDERADNDDEADSQHGIGIAHSSKSI